MAKKKQQERPAKGKAARAAGKQPRGRQSGKKHSPPAQSAARPHETAHDESAPGKERQTSKVELQSLNDQLQTVNRQLQQKVEELESAHNDLQDLLASTDIAIVFLDRQLRIKRFTPPTARLFRLIESDTGRPIADITRNFNDESMLDDAHTVLAHLTPAEAEVQDVQHRWYLRRIVPYRAGENRIEGVVITFADITSRKQNEQSLLTIARRLEDEADQTRARLAAVLQTTPAAILTANLAGVIESWNQGAEKLYGYSPDEVVGRGIAMLMPADRSDDFQRTLARLRQGEVVQDYETVRLHKDGTRIDVALTVSLMQDKDGAACGICSISRDIRERKLLEQQVADLANKERQQIGQDLHDRLGQEITAMGMLLATLKGQLDPKSPQAAVVEKLEASADEARQRLRTIAKGLFPVDVDALGLRVALEGLARDIEAVYKISCRFDCPQDVLLADNFTATQLFLIAREAAQNAGKHARANALVISLHGNDAIHVTVSDNGIGLPEGFEHSDGMGLRIMRHRCGLIGGTLSFEKAAGGGTIVKCQMCRRPEHGKS